MAFSHRSHAIKRQFVSLEKLTFVIETGFIFSETMESYFNCSGQVI